MTTPPGESDNRARNDEAANSDSKPELDPSSREANPRCADRDLRADTNLTNRRQSRRSTQEQEPSDIYAPPRRRSVRRDQEEAKPGVWSRLTGRHRLDEIREARYEPYTYESNEQNLKWTAVAMGIWCLALVWLAFTDWSNSRRYQEWVDEGVVLIPPSADIAQQIESARHYAQREGGEEFKCAYLGGASSTDECPDGETSAIAISDFVEESGAICTNFAQHTETSEQVVPDDRAVTTGLETETSEPVEVCTAVWTYYPLLEFARQTHLNCPDVDAILASIASEGIDYPDCEAAFTYAEQFQQSQDRSRLIWLFTVFLGVFVAFPYLSLVHRASRNLLPLKSEQQKHTAEWAVLHHFIPLLNWLRPGQVMIEMFKASDPDVTTEDPTAWKKEGKPRPILALWWILWVASWVFNPITVPRFVNAQSLQELIDANNMLALSDVLLIVLGISAVLMLRQLHVWQEMRFSKIGLITVTPPPPVDPLAEALKKQEEKQREKEAKKKRRGR